MLNFFLSVFFLFLSIFFITFGYRLLTKTEYTLLKYIKMFGIYESTYTYKYMTNKKKIWHYKLVSIFNILMGIFLLLFIFMKG